MELLDTNDFVTQTEFARHCETVNNSIGELKTEIGGQRKSIGEISKQLSGFHNFKNYAWAIIILLITLDISVIALLVNLITTLANHIANK